MKTLKKLVLTTALILSFSCTFSQSIKQFNTTEIILLFEKNKAEVHKFLESKNYDFEGKDSGLDKFTKVTPIGKFIINVSFNKMNKVNSISLQEHMSTSNLISSDLYSNNFKIRKLLNMNNGQDMEFDDHIIPFSGCIYSLNNYEKKIMVTFIISPYNPNVISLNYGRLTGKDYENESKLINAK
ncbi:hypothetical protein [Flavobacterium sp.]|uniref:hypothetical protein n=1 Tax=Flavobacterium sp. TaxID=239 RepID=UPI00286BCCE6|nr:hypothetical protein [Flavobacterium sp.]